VTLGGMLLVVRWRLWGFLAALGVLVLYIAGAYVLFSLQTQGAVGNGPVEVPSIGYVIPAAFWWVIGLGYLLFEEQLAVSRTQNTFGRFVTPAVARTIMDREETGQLALGGEDRRVTVLFGDIRGFTTISEGMTPAILLGHLNRYFDGMVTIVNRYEGSVNKYNGDNIMVIWGAPIEVADEARKAVECALEMQKWIQAERAKGGPDVSFGFGINTGHVVAGFLGALGRMEYTVIGDTANVASRLQRRAAGRARQRRRLRRSRRDPGEGPRGAGRVLPDQPHRRAYESERRARAADQGRERGRGRVPLIDMLDDKVALILVKLGHLSVQRDREAYLRGLVELCSQAVDAERCTFYVVDQQKQELWARVAQRTSTEIRLPIGQGLAGQSALTGETINVPDAYADSRFDRKFDMRTGFRTLNVLVVPVWGSQGKPVAVIQVLNKRNGTFERRDQMLLEQIAETIAPVAEHITSAD